MPTRNQYGHEYGTAALYLRLSENGASEASHGAAVPVHPLDRWEEAAPATFHPCLPRLVCATPALEQFQLLLRLCQLTVQQIVLVIWRCESNNLLLTAGLPELPAFDRGASIYGIPSAYRGKLSSFEVCLQCTQAHATDEQQMGAGKPPRKRGREMVIRANGTQRPRALL